MTTPTQKRATYTMGKMTRCTIELMQGYVNTEKCQSQILRVVSGTAWVSMNGEDIILQPGEELNLSNCRHDAVVSATGNEPLVYEFED